MAYKEFTVSIPDVPASIEALHKQVGKIVKAYEAVERTEALKNAPKVEAPKQEAKEPVVQALPTDVTKGLTYKDLRSLVKTQELDIEGVATMKGDELREVLEKHDNIKDLVDAYILSITPSND